MISQTSIHVYVCMYVLCVYMNCMYVCIILFLARRLCVYDVNIMYVFYVL